jgi:hypothetical protein
MMFQKNSKHMTNGTWYSSGIHQKLIVIATGHIIQFIINVSQIFSLQLENPFLNPLIEKSFSSELYMKNPTKYNGVNISWSADIRVKTRDDFLVVYLKIRFPNDGKILQYHR